jgi:cytochrome c oxidase subunit III
MANPSSTTIASTGPAWEGGKSPFAVSWGKMYMWFFLVSDAFTFSGLLIAYGALRHKFIDVWPKANEVFVHFPFVEGHIPLAYVGMMTFILIISSVTMVLAVDAGHRMNRKNVIFWLGLTVVGGLVFLGSQAWEWYHFIVGTPEGRVLADGSVIHGANLVINEYGHPLFADFFFFITGFHGFHVFSGVVINAVILVNVINGVYEKRGHYEQVEKSGLYWHFVDLVWVFVFTMFYLI